jgi:plasmid stabilization system protein ParE
LDPFLAAVREARKLIEEHPNIGSAMRGAKRGERGLMVRRFPYQLIYYVRSDDIVLVAVAHTKRRPGYWKRRAIPPAT